MWIFSSPCCWFVGCICSSKAIAFHWTHWEFLNIWNKISTGSAYALFAVFLNTQNHPVLFLALSNWSSTFNSYPTAVTLIKFTNDRSHQFHQIQRSLTCPYFTRSSNNNVDHPFFSLKPLLLLNICWVNKWVNQNLASIFGPYWDIIYLSYSISSIVINFYKV